MYPTVRAAGFTLLEMLVALAVFAIVAATAYGGISAGSRAFSSGADRADGLEVARAVQHFLAARIEGAAPVAERTDGRWRLRFRGRADRLDLVTEMPPWVGTAGLYDVSLAFERSPTGHLRLVAWWAPFGDRLAGTPVSTRVLAEHLEEGGFDYYGALDAKSAPGWQAAWEDAERAPRLVRVRVSDAAVGAWPALTIGPRADAVRYLRTRGTEPEPDQPGVPFVDPATGAPVPSEDEDGNEGGSNIQ